MRIILNGQMKEIEADPDKPLLWILRDDLGLVGTKYGCGQALCGSCTVHVDGQAVRSCSAAMEDINGKQVLTIEALHPTGDHPGQKGPGGNCRCRNAAIARPDRLCRRPPF